MRIMIALLLFISLAVLVLRLTYVRESDQQVVATPYAQSRIRDAVRQGNPPNMTGTPDSPGYGKPNVSSDVARRYGQRHPSATGR